jgi:hypothetical protein
MADPTNEPYEDAAARQSRSAESFAWIDPVVLNGARESQELSDLAWDETVRSRLHAVAVPPKLEERILNRLMSSQFRKTPRLEWRYDEVWSRRRWLAVGGASIAAGLSAIAVGWFHGPGQPTLIELTSGARQWYGDVIRRTDWSASSPPFAQYPFPQAWLSAVPTRWLSLATPWDRRAVAYGVKSPSGGTGMLFVLRAPSQMLERRPPSTPSNSSQGLSAGAWSERDWSYALVAAGGVADYRAFLRNNLSIA